MLLARLPTPLLAATVLLLSSAAARFSNDFSPYPARARSCLEDADADSGCDGNTVPIMNACLCADGGSFLTNSARCIGQESPGDLRAVYSLLKINCDGSNTSMDLSEDEFRSIASEDEISSTSKSSKPTETATDESTDAPSKPTETADENDSGEDDGDEDDGEDGGGLSKGATIGIAVAATGVGVGLIAAAIFMFLRRRRLNKASREEANPMLGGGGGGSGNGGNSHLSFPASTVFNPLDSPTYQDHLSAGKVGSPGIQAWGPDSFIPGTGPTPPPMHEQQQQQQQQQQHEQQRWSQASPPPPMQQQQMQQQQMHPQQWDQSRPTSWDPQSRVSWGGAHPQQGYQPAVPAAGSQVMPPAQLAPPAVGEVFELASTPRGYQQVAPVEMPGSQP